MTGEDLAQAYASSDIFVFPSAVDTMGNVVVKVQASDLPVIVTDQGGPVENMIADHTGMVIHANESTADHFAEAVLWLSENPQTLEVMRKNDRSFENNFFNHWNTWQSALYPLSDGSS